MNRSPRSPVVRAAARIRARRVIGSVLAAMMLAVGLSSTAEPVWAGTVSAHPLSELDARLAFSTAGVQADIAERLLAARLHHDRAGELLALRDQIRASEVLMDGASAENIKTGIALATDLGDDETRAVLMAHLGLTLFHNGNQVEGNRWFDSAAALAEDRTLVDALPRIYFLRADAELNRGAGPNALVWLDKAFRGYERGNSTVGVALTLESIATGIRAPEDATTEDLHKSLEYLERAVNLLDPVQHRAILATVLSSQGMTQKRLSQLDGAKASFARALELARMSNTAWVPYLQFRLGTVELEQGHAAPAERYFEQALPGLLRLSDPVQPTLLLISQARAQAQVNKTTASLATLESAGTRARKLGIPRLLTDYYSAVSDIQVQFGDYRLAHQATKDLLDLERDAAKANTRKLAEELKVRFDVKLKDSDNALLRARQAESESRRLALGLTLALALMVLAGGGLVLYLQTRQKRKFASLALMDELTGAPNRRSMLDLARRRLDGRRDSDDRFWIAILDIDHFKSVNDRFGHDVGDAVLCKFLATCQKSLRSTDILGRWGGEEFLLLSREFDPAAVMTLFDRLLDAVGGISSPDFPSSLRITFSMGACDTTGAQGSLEDLIKRADEALYKAKAQGRARCVISTPPTLATSGDAR